MLSNQTTEILKTLSKEELKRFGDFVKSPYFNTSKPIEKIFDIVQKEHPKFKSNALEFNRMFKKLYPSEEYKEKRIKNLYSEFSILLKKFLGYEQISVNKRELDIHIVTFLTQKNLNKISDRVIAKSLKDNDDGLLSIGETFNYLYNLNISHIVNIEEKRQQGSPEYQKSDIELMEKLVIFSMMNIFQHSFYDIMNQNVFKVEANPVLEEVVAAIDIEKILSYFTSRNHPYASYLKIHYLFYYYSVNDMSEENYEELKKEIFKTIDKVRKVDQSQFIMRMIHMVVAKLVFKNAKYYEDIIEFAELFSKLKIYPDENFHAFNLGTFQDIFIVAMSLKKFDWAENFVNEYINYLNKDQQADQENYCRGILSYNRGKFEDSLHHLGKVKLVGLTEKINIRFYYLMNYIELESYESALSILHSFRQYISDSNEIPEMYIEGVNETLKYFAEIIKFKANNEKPDEYILNEAREGKGFFYKGYIIEKLSGA